MKKWFKIAFPISLAISCVLTVELIRESRSRTYKMELAPAFKIKNLDVKKEKNKFFSRLTAMNPSVKNKKYIFATIWDPANFGYEDLPSFDTAVQPLRNDMAYVLISDETTAYVNLKLKRKNIKTNNFIYLNEADSFIHAIFQERKMKTKWQFLLSMPTTLILDQKGNILHFDTICFFKRDKDSAIIYDKYFQSINKTLNELK